MVGVNRDPSPPLAVPGLPGRARWPVAALVIVVAALAVEWHALRETVRVNTAIERGELGALAERDTPRGHLAQAYRLHLEGRLEEALEAYRAVSVADDPEVREVVHYNLANLYLQRAVQLERAGEESLAISLVELAKENYRVILARNPEHWDARHNLSRALQILPDLPSVNYEDDVMPERSPQAPRSAPAFDQLP